MRISAVVLTKNEEKNIEKCLKSVVFCDEIIIIDDFSSDKTIEEVHKILKVHKAYKVFQRHLNGDFALQRNFGLNKAAGEWVFFVDADEEVTSELAKEINERVIASETKQSPQGYYIKRRDFWWGRELRFGEIRTVRNKGIVRLVKKDSGLWMGNVHEVFHTAKSVGSLDGFLNHFPHPTVADFLRDINLYSTLRAKELFARGKKTNVFEIVFFPLGKFILNYFIYLGFLDGPAGFTYAFFMSFHSFLVRVKLFQYTHA